VTALLNFVSKLAFIEFVIRSVNELSGTRTNGITRRQEKRFVLSSSSCSAQKRHLCEQRTRHLRVCTASQHWGHMCIPTTRSKSQISKAWLLLTLCHHCSFSVPAVCFLLRKQGVRLPTLLLEDCPSEHQLGSKISRGKLPQATENCLHTNEAEPSTGQSRSSGTAAVVEQADEGHGQPHAAQASPPRAQSIPGPSEELVGGECTAVLIMAN